LCVAGCELRRAALLRQIWHHEVVISANSGHSPFIPNLDIQICFSCHY
jgi:hypothetical protein